MPKAAMIRARTDAELKQQVEEIFDKLGLNATSALNLFYKQVLLNNGLPFDVKIPNTKTRKAMDDARKGKVVKGFKSPAEVFKSLSH